MFNYAKAKESARKLMNNKKLQLVVLGCQGAGKSYCIGTLKARTLYMYGTREGHGPVSASTQGGANITPICMDYGFWGDEKVERKFTADESYKMLEQVLKDHKWMKEEGFEAIAIDGLAVLEGIVKETTAWKEKCRSASGKHNSFRESESSQELIGNILGWLKAAQLELDVHVVVTGILDVKETDQYGAVIEASPRLGGYGLAESLNQHMADIVVLSKMTRDGEQKYKFQFFTDLCKISKTETGEQKKAMNFNPRLTGVAEVPPIMDADLAKLAALKAGSGTGK